MKYWSGGGVIDNLHGIEEARVWDVTEDAMMVIQCASQSTLQPVKCHAFPGRGCIPTPL